MDNFNFDENTINKLKAMMDNGELNDVLSQISPDIIQNFNLQLLSGIPTSEFNKLIFDQYRRAETY